MEPPTGENGVSGRRQHVVALPYPGWGHVNPMLSLSRCLASRGLLLTVVVTEEWLELLSSSAAAPEAATNVRLRTIPNVLPSERHRGADFASFIQAVLTRMGAPVGELLAGIDPPADAIVADSLLPWAAGIAKRRGIPVAALFPQSAAVFLALHELKSLDDAGPPEIRASGKENGHLSLNSRENGYLDYIPRTSSSHFSDFMSNSPGQGMLRSFIQGISWFSTAECLLFPSSYELESHAMDILASKLSVPIHPIGPAIRYMTLEYTNTDHYCRWLDSQPQGSVLYVSLGSFLPISSTHMEEMAMGLRTSGIRFLWVVRGELTRVKELSGDTGFVVPWCDQLKVLCHHSVGGFLTHCGWNSTLEGVYAGVPMLTFPLMWDQFPNSKLIVEDWNVGLRLKDDEEERVVGREEVAKVVRKFMDSEAEEAKELRRRVRELRETCHVALKAKGSSVANLDAFVREVIPCGEKDGEPK